MQPGLVNHRWFYKQPVEPSPGLEERRRDVCVYTRIVRVGMFIESMDGEGAMEIVLIYE